MSAQNTNTVLAIFPALTIPVTTAQAKTLASNLQQINNWNNRQVLGLSILGLIYLLNHAGGTNYKTNIPQLVIDAEAFMGGFEAVGNFRLPGSILDNMEAVCDWNSAYDVDTTISTNTNTLLTNIGLLQDVPESTLRSYIVFLRYACAIKGV